MLTGDHRLHHGPARDPEDVTDHAGEFDLCVFEQFLAALLLPRAFSHQRSAVPGEIPQLTNQSGMHQAGRAHARSGNAAPLPAAPGVRLFNGLTNKHQATTTPQAATDPIFSPARGDPPGAPTTIQLG